ncbi:2-dehydro-3-deoxyphosphooctonate aldolase [Phenylobacterium zucineum HLK1]|uniref:3-deoxy-8-phosphooctulonate synthase n=1 Tax=Phenylobacterium zucineum (strain HLK1) TaxID=450851 RepID=B4RAY6_PHEZH|nr:3-deoxy-8-phosphooctulonate synthase [Phenylobacterium zucineum]ACG78037.1 2-dehydro-3-deoxyphosphooctonate aldolase [Phenylobacterium zucineum HLK1]
MAVLKLDRWNLAIGDGQPLVVIAGLNVLEDEALALATARHLKAACERLQLPFVFKASFDKANRSSISSYRGPGLEAGLAMLKAVKDQVGVPIATDIHEPGQAGPLAEVVDLLQIPAFLCRQTDLVVASARAIHAAGGLLHVKKGQFLAPWDAKNIVSKVKEATGGAEITVLCERGSSFGYNNLVVDMLGIGEMKKLGCPVTIDATHAVQLPGADPRTGGASTGGRREGVAVIARAAVVSGADGVFLEFHPDPDKALCDGPSCLPLDGAEPLLRQLKALHEVARAA